MVPIRSAAVLEDGGQLAHLLRAMPELRALPLVRPDADEFLRCALLLVAPDFTGAAPDAHCRILLTPPDKAQQLRAVRADWVVSYGAGRRESLSFSSLDGGTLVLSVRRALPLLTGRRLETQEMPWRCPAAAPEEMLAACAAALLLTGGTA